MKRFDKKRNGQKIFFLLNNAKNSVGNNTQKFRQCNDIYIKC